MEYILICVYAQERWTQYSDMRVHMLCNSSCYLLTKNFGNLNYYFRVFWCQINIFHKNYAIWDIDRVESWCQGLQTYDYFGNILALEKKLVSNI